MLVADAAAVTPYVAMRYEPPAARAMRGLRYAARWRDAYDRREHAR